MHDYYSLYYHMLVAEISAKVLNLQCNLIDINILQNAHTRAQYSHFTSKIYR